MSNTHNVPGSSPRILWVVGIIAALVGAIVVGCWPADPNQPKYRVSQKGQQFSEKELNVARGEAIRIINDDGDLRHHAYVDSPTFRVDTGDQEPGTNTDITFSVPGSFDVLCAIHPKMKMRVIVK